MHHVNMVFQSHVMITLPMILIQEKLLLYQRNADDAYIVEYSPVLLLNWNGHAHVHILKTYEFQHNIDKLIYYVAKYNMKAEPSLRVETDLNDNRNYHHTFTGRIVSSEEAAS